MFLAQEFLKIFNSFSTETFFKICDFLDFLKFLVIFRVMFLVQEFLKIFSSFSTKTFFKICDFLDSSEIFSDISSNVAGRNVMCNL